MLAVLRDIAKAVAADNSAGLQNNTVAQHAVLTDSGVRIQSAVLAHFYTFANVSMRIDNAAVTNNSIILNNSKRLDSNIRTNLCFLGNKSIGADNALYLLLRTEQLQQCSKGSTRISHSDNRTAIKLRILRTQHHNTSLAQMAMLNMRRYSKGNILRTSFNKTVDTGDFQLRIIMLHRSL